MQVLVLGVEMVFEGLSRVVPLVVVKVVVEKLVDCAIVSDASKSKRFLTIEFGALLSVEILSCFSGKLLNGVRSLISGLFIQSQSGWDVGWRGTKW